METMLQESSEFCKQNWASQVHQQVCSTDCIFLCFHYHVFYQLIYEVVNGVGSIQLITLKPGNLSKEETSRFQALGIHIPSREYGIK